MAKFMLYLRLPFLCLLLFVQTSWANPGPEVPISVTVVHYQPVSKTVFSSGQVRPHSEQRLGFKINGRVESVLVTEGEVVSKGQPLAILEKEEFSAQLAKAEALLADNQRQFSRQQVLRKQDLTSDEQVRLAETAVAVARADRRIAQSNYDQTVIKAPSDGRILLRHIEPNEIINANTIAFTFADETAGWGIELQVADIDVVRLQLGDYTGIQLDAFPGETFQGRVNKIAGRADNRSLTFAVTIDIRNPPQLYSGLVAHVEVKPSHQEFLAPIPLSALLTARGQKGEVYILDENNFPQKKTVDIAFIDNQQAYIRQGLAEGSQLVVQGAPFITNGSSVSIIP